MRASPSARPAAAPVPTPRTLYADDFRADPVGVTEDGGEHVLAHSPGSGLGLLLTGSPGWSSYQVAVDVKVLTPKTGFAGIVGRFQSSGDYYECVIHHDESVLLWRLQGGQGVQLGGTQHPIDVTRFHRLALSLEGDRLTCSLDSVTLATSTDGTLSMGRPGLIASSGEAAEFDHVAVTEGRSPATATPAPRAAGTPAPAASPPAATPPPATPTATPASPTPPPPAPPTFVRAPQRAARGTSTTVTVHTTPGATCTLVPANPLVAAQAGGLAPLTADAQGTASWTWQVGALTPRGAVPVRITCADAAVQTTVDVV
jgi:hypothetical protein